MRSRGAPALYWTIDDQSYISDAPWIMQEMERKMEHLTQFIEPALTVMLF